MASSIKALNKDGRGATVVTFATSNIAHATPPFEPTVKFDNNVVTHTYKQHDDPSSESKSSLQVEAANAIRKVRMDPPCESKLETDTSVEPMDAISMARKTLSASDDIEAKWKAFQNAFDAMNKLLVENISEQMMKAEKCKKEHVTIDIQTATKMLKESSNIVILTGAGISVSSGLPTYRGNDGVWTKSSKNYTPEEIATLRVFEEDTEWSWEYYRGVAARCQAAKPNVGHKALVEIQRHFENEGKKFQLVTTNIDDLHRRAGSKNFFELHGNITKTRCTNPECRGELIRDLPGKEEDVISNVPRCKFCDEMKDTGLKPPLRPHILWFDEGYEEHLHSIKSVFRAVEAADLLLTIGGTCTTGGPRRILDKAHEFDIPVIDLNPTPNNDICEVKLHQLLSTADDALPTIVKSLQRSSVSIKGKSKAKAKQARKNSSRVH
jgi:NAD-dependent deacetylase